MIGLSTTCVESCIDWLDFLLKKNIKVIELSHGFTPIYFAQKDLDKITDAINKGVDISLHSGTTYLLNSDKEIAKQQLLLLKSEIKFASKVGIKNIVFHLHSDLKADNKKIQVFLKSIIAFANKNKVTLCLENGSSGPWSISENLIKLFKKFKSMRHIIDVGHLNVAANGDINKFSKYLKKLKPYTEYFHIHDNNGIRDEHNEIGKGNIDFGVVFKYYSKNKYRFIIEARNFKSAVNSMKRINNK